MVIEIYEKNNLSKNQIKISPSVLSLQIENIYERVKKIEKNIEYIHIDVMDGKFVTNSTDGVAMFNEAKKVSSQMLDVHLMVENPLEEITKYKGAEIITFHIESLETDKEILEVIEEIRKLNAKVGISIKPNTPVSILTKWLDKIDLVLIMTVEPGYGGQKLIYDVLPKVKELRDLGFDKLIEADGGITIDNAKDVINAGVDIIVVGTAIFNAEDENEVILTIKNL